MTNPQPGSRPLPPPTAPPGDPLLADRLARLAARSAAHRTGTPPTGPGAATRQVTGPPMFPTAPTAPAGQAVRPATGNRPGKRRHAAKGSRIAALTMSVLSTGGLTAFFAHADGALASGDGGDTAVAAGATAVVPTATAASTTAAATTVAAPVESPTPAATAAPETTAVPETTAAPAGAGYTDGVYVGAESRNRWGTVQVQVTVSGGSITDVSTLQYPDSDRKSVRINERALPTLQSQAIAAQSSQINGVSGATYTTNSYIASLQSALDQA